MARSANTPNSHAAFTQLAIIAQAACILLILGYSQTVETAIFACQSGQTVVYQDRPCPQEKPQENARKSGYNFPLSIHESWFDLPEQAIERAFCDRRGCECGRIEKKHHDTLIQSIADALYLDGSWHRYDTVHQAWLESAAATTKAYELKDQMLEATCEIMMSQTLLRNYADDAIKILKKRVRTAEELGFDVELPCEQGIPQACEFYESVQLLNRLITDASALRQERVEILLPGQAILSASDAASDP